MKIADQNIEELKHLIYDVMNGALTLNPSPLDEIVENEFEVGKPCSKAYNSIYVANQMLCNRLGVEEDRDIECIINSFFSITEYMCMKMFDYGALFSKTIEE